MGGSEATLSPDTNQQDGRRYLQVADLRRLQNLQFAAKLIVEGFYQGKHRSPFYDYSSEFADYRPYTPGDEIRAIDWRAYARTDRYYIKLFRKETDMNCYLLVDTSNSMAYRGTGSGNRRGDKVRRQETSVSKLEYAGYLAAGLAYLIIQQGDKAGVALGGEKLQAFVPAGGTPQNLQRILVALERAAPGGPTGLATTLKGLFGTIKRKGLLVVISDFLDEPDQIFSALSMFTHKGFAILLFQVLTDEEMLLPPLDSALFEDMESSAFVVAEPNAVRVAYQAELQAFLHEMESNAKARRIYYRLATTSQPYHEALEAYLTVRRRG
jgi:uncharacterized protein (DUF58 family)